MFLNKKNTKIFSLVSLISVVFFFSSTLYAQSSVPSVDSFTLVNADTGEGLAVYTNDSGLSTGSVSIADAARISFRFNTSNTRSVRINGVSAQPRVENQQPYSLLGDDGTIYEPWSPGVGVYNITVEPFAGGNTSGEQGASAMLRFTVTETVGVPNPPPSPKPDSSAIQIMPSINHFLLDDELIDPSEEQQVVVIVGASIVQQAFGQDLTQTDDVIMSKLHANGVNNIDFYSYGFTGTRINNILSRIDIVLATFPEAKVIVHAGGNDVTATRPYATRSQEEIDKFTSDIEALIAKFSGIEDQLILIPLTFRSYANIHQDDSMFLDGSSGSEPFNINEYLPRIPENQKNIDGQHILDWFNLTRNNRFLYSGSDGIHLNRFGNEALRQLVADRLGYLINGGERPEIIVRDEGL